MPGILALSLVLFTSALRVCAQSGSGAPAPYASIATDSETYAGPGRNAVYDEKGPLLRIGILVPRHGPEQAEGDAMLAAARLAMQDADQHRLPGGRHLELAVGDESGPSWGRVSDAVIHLALDQNALVLITPASGTDAHLCEQVGNRIGIPVLTLAADPATTQIDIPWIFRLGPSDTLQARLITHDAFRARGLKNVLLVTEADYDGASGGHAMQQAAQSLGLPLAEHLSLNPLHPDVASVVREINSRQTRAVILWTSAQTAGAVLRAIHSAGISLPVYLSQQAAQPGSRLVFPPPQGWRRTGAHSQVAWTAVTDNADRADAPESNTFASRYRKLTGENPGPAAAETYDAVRLTALALQDVGPNRARIRDWLAKLQGFQGASGVITFDSQGNTTTQIHLVPLQLREQPATEETIP
jgi:branched-chain amino acid transport system substrate-binding protein